MPYHVIISSVPMCSFMGMISYMHKCSPKTVIKIVIIYEDLHRQPFVLLLKYAQGWGFSHFKYKPNILIDVSSQFSMI